MEEKVLKNVCIRLADGRFACLALASHPDGTFETTITTDGPTQKKIFSKKFEGQKEAVDFFEYLKEDRHVPEPVGRYKQLAADLEQAKNMTKNKWAMMTADLLTLIPFLSTFQDGERS